ncbi:MAG: MFS transporter [Firmicutes bacterium]|nr:MFS transporter [Bacillota bacterium]
MGTGVSLSLSLRYGAGYAGIAIVTQTVLVWLAYFYAPPSETGLPALVPIGWVGTAMLLGRIVDAAADPLVGAWSDAARTRWGRRRPFLVFGSLPLALSFLFLWWPPAFLTTLGLAVYLGIMVSLFLFCFTVYTAPYLALLPELARTQADRVRLATWQAVFQIAGLAVAMIGSGLLIDRFGFGGMGLVLAALALVAFLVPAASVREEPAAGPRSPGLIPSLVLCLRNRPFLYYAASQMLFWIGLNAVVVAAPYFVTVLMGGTEADASVALGLSFAVAVASFPLLGKLSAARGLKGALQRSMAALVAALLGWGLVGRLPLPVPPFGQGLAVFAVAGLSVAGLFVLPNAMMAEIADYDYRLNGLRREAMFFGVQGLLVKAAMGLSSFLVGWLMETLGFTADRPAGLVAVGPLAAAFVAVGMLVLSRYPEQAVRSGTRVQTVPPASSSI